MVPSDNPESELTNKNETELPIGDPQDPAKRDSVMWRCGDCGELDRLTEELPEACPACGAGREELYRWEED